MKLWIKKLSTLLILFSVILFFNCSNENKKCITSYFKKEKALVHNKLILSNGKELLHPSKLLSYDSLLIVGNFRTFNLFSIINLNQHKIINNFGKTGQGPGEFVLNFQLFRAGSFNGFYAPDIGSRRLYRYAMTEDIFQGTPEPEDIFSHSLNEVSENHILYYTGINDSIFIGLGIFSQARFLIFNKNKFQYSYQIDYPEDDNKEKISNALKGNAYQGFLRSNENRIVYASANSELIELYDYASDSLYLKKAYTTVLPVYKAVHEGKGSTVATKFNNIGRYISLTTSKDKIFLLYLKKEIESPWPSDYKTNQVLVFDWEGNPVVTYQLDCEVKTIETSPDGKRLYAIYDNPDPEIIYFDL